MASNAWLKSFALNYFLIMKNSMNIKLIMNLLYIAIFLINMSILSMNALYAPWREQYLHDKPIPQQFELCPFCAQTAENNDEQRLFLRRFEHTIIALNLFPYSKGHLLLIPKYHVRNISDLSQEARHELIDLIAASVDILKKEFNISGANVGLNLEQCSGASIQDHIHVHIIPRKPNDSSFINIIGNTNVICWDLKKLYEQLKPAFEEIRL